MIYGNARLRTRPYNRHPGTKAGTGQLVFESGPTPFAANHHGMDRGPAGSYFTNDAALILSNRRARENYTNADGPGNTNLNVSNQFPIRLLECLRAAK